MTIGNGQQQERVTRRDELLDGLEEGIDGRFWRPWAASSKSLQVRICRLRSEGFNIVSEPVPRSGFGRPSVIYRLVK